MYLICNWYLTKVLILIFIKTDFKLHSPNQYAKVFAQRIIISCLTSKEDKTLSNNINFRDNSTCIWSAPWCIYFPLSSLRIWIVENTNNVPREQTILPSLFYFTQLTHNRCLLSEGSFVRALGYVPLCLWILEWIPASWNLMKEMKLPFLSQVLILYHRSWITRLNLQLMLNMGIKILLLLVILTKRKGNCRHISYRNAKMKCD